MLFLLLLSLLLLVVASMYNPIHSNSERSTAGHFRNVPVEKGRYLWQQVMLPFLVLMYPSGTIMHCLRWSLIKISFISKTGPVVAPNLLVLVTTLKDRFRLMTQVGFYPRRGSHRPDENPITLVENEWLTVCPSLRALHSLCLAR